MHLAPQRTPSQGVVLEEGRSMDPKLAILFTLIGCIIVLSHLGDGTFDRMRRLSAQRWRQLVPGRRRL